MGRWGYCLVPFQLVWRQSGFVFLSALTSVGALFYFPERGKRMKEMFLYNPKRHTLHIKGYCIQTQNGYPDYYIPFDTENEALAHDGRAVGWCKLCQKKRELKMEETK